MSLDLRTAPPWLATVLLAEDDTEESVIAMGSDLHQEAMGESHATLFEYAEELVASGAPSWYVSTQVTVITSLPERARLLEDDLAATRAELARLRAWPGGENAQ